MRDAEMMDLARDHDPPPFPKRHCSVLTAEELEIQSFD